MSQAISAIYQNGHFVPLLPVSGLLENQSVKLNIVVSRKKEHPLMRFVGVIDEKEAKELSKTVEEEFEKVTDKTKILWSK